MQVCFPLLCLIASLLFYGHTKYKNQQTNYDNQNRINNNNPTLLKQSLITAAKPDLDNLSPHKYCWFRLSSVLWSRPPGPINIAAAVSGPILLLRKPTDKYHYFTFTFNIIFVKYVCISKLPASTEELVMTSTLSP